MRQELNMLKLVLLLFAVVFVVGVINTIVRKQRV